MQIYLWWIDTEQTLRTKCLKDDCYCKQLEELVHVKYTVILISSAKHPNKCAISKLQLNKNFQWGSSPFERHEVINSG